MDVRHSEVLGVDDAETENEGDEAESSAKRRRVEEQKGRA